MAYSLDGDGGDASDGFRGRLVEVVVIDQMDESQETQIDDEFRLRFRLPLSRLWGHRGRSSGFVVLFGVSIYVHCISGGSGSVRLVWLRQERQQMLLDRLILTAGKDPLLDRQSEHVGVRIDLAPNIGQHAQHSRSKTLLDVRDTSLDQQKVVSQQRQKLLPLAWRLDSGHSGRLDGGSFLLGGLGRLGHRG